MAEDPHEQPEPHFYTRDLKLEAVRLSESSEQTVAQIARDRGVPERVLSRWRHELREQQEQAVPGKGQHSELEEENRRLKRERELLKQQRAVLKEAVALFSRRQPCSRRSARPTPPRAPSACCARRWRCRRAAPTPGVAAVPAGGRRPRRR